MRDRRDFLVTVVRKEGGWERNKLFQICPDDAEEAGGDLFRAVFEGDGVETTGCFETSRRGIKGFFDLFFRFWGWFAREGGGEGGSSCFEKSSRKGMGRIFAFDF